MEKKFLSYLPVSLYKGNRWQLSFYQTPPGQSSKIRIIRSFELNRIRDKRDRMNHAVLLKACIDSLLPYGYPFPNNKLTQRDITNLLIAVCKICKVQYQFDQLDQLPTVHVGIFRHIKSWLVDSGFDKALSTYTDPGELSINENCPIIEVMKKARDIKAQSDRAKTNAMYRSLFNVFSTFLLEQKYDQMPIGVFKQTHAIEFLDWIYENRKVSARTYNNYIIRMKAIFTPLVSREYIAKNPFKGLVKKKTLEAKWRSFTSEERNLVSNFIRDQDYWLFTALLLQYHCLIRPNEVRQLKFEMFDFQLGVINIPATITKNKKDRTVTIPNIDLPHFLDDRFSKWPASYFVFGARGEGPHPKQSIGRDTLSKRHKQILTKLHKAGLLKNINGLTFYSWKYTGVTDLTDDASIQPQDVQQQAGHASIDQTMSYYRRKKVNTGIRNLKTKI